MPAGTLPLLTELLGWTLAVAATITAWPQAVRVLRTGNVTGVSPQAAATAVTAMTAWCVFTAERGDLPALASSIGPLVAWLVVLGGVLRARTIGAMPALAVAAAGVAVTVTAGLSGHAAAVGLVAAIGSAAWAVPQLVTAYKRTDLTGVSPMAFWLIAAENAGWVAYASMTGTPAYALAPIVQGPASALIAVRASRSHRRAACKTMHPAGMASLSSAA